MWAWGGARWWGKRALSVALVAALVVAGVVAIVVAPRAVGRPVPTSSALPFAAARFDSGRRTVAGREVGPASPVASTAVALSLVQPGPAPTGSGSDPTTEAGVAARLIAAIDARSGGRYAIRATADNVALLETWMDNEGGLWADNPLNTSLDAARYPHQITATGDDTQIPIFPDIQIGIDATATTLLSNRAYSGILWTLSEGTATCGAFARAVMASPWAASHYGGDPSHFCGASGQPGAPGVGVAACLRVRDRSGPMARRAQRMPGACGRQAPGTGRAAAGHGRPQRQKAQGAPARLHHHRSAARAAPPSHPRPVGHGPAAAAAGGGAPKRLHR